MDSETSEEAKEIARIKTRIASVIESLFDGGLEVVYLSRLGNELGTDRLTLERLTHMKLAQYLRENFEYAIGRTGQHENIVYLARPGNGVAVSASAHPKYAPRFWTAFAKPLAPGQSARFINLETFTFGPEEAILQGGAAAEIRRIDPEFNRPPRRVR